MISSINLRSVRSIPLSGRGRCVWSPSETHLRLPQHPLPRQRSTRTRKRVQLLCRQWQTSRTVLRILHRCRRPASLRCCGRCCLTPFLRSNSRPPLRWGAWQTRAMSWPVWSSRAIYCPSWSTPFPSSTREWLSACPPIPLSVVSLWITAGHHMGHIAALAFRTRCRSLHHHYLLVTLRVASLVHNMSPLDPKPPRAQTHTMLLRSSAAQSLEEGGSVCAADCCKALPRVGAGCGGCRCR